MSQHAELPPGTILDGKWRLERLLGLGGMGAVYAATHVRNGGSAAIKLLHPDLVKDAQLRERFLHEGYAANKVGHPGVVRILDDGQSSGGHTYLVMELLVGETADARLARRGGRLPPSEVLAILDKLLETLAAAHASGTVHRDIKPENVFLTSDGGLKVLDFGLARVREATTQARLTVTGVPMGTPAFMPAEQAMARWDEVNAQSDVYSIGATAWYLLTGRLVHEGRTVPELLVAVSTKHAAPIRTLVPELSEAVAHVLDRALLLDRAARFSEAGEMLVALRAAVRGQSIVGAAAARSGVGLGYETTAKAAFSSPAQEAARRLLPTTPEAHAALPFQGPAGVGTVAPVTTDPGRRAARDTKGKIVLGVAAFTGAVAIGVGAFAFATHRAPGASGSASALDPPPPSPAGVGAGEPRSSSSSPTVTASSSSPSSSSPSSASPPGKPSSKPPSKPAPAPKPASAPPDPLSTYRKK